MSDTDDSNIPSAAECEARCQQFAAVTGTDTALAMFYLQDREWDVEVNVVSVYSCHLCSLRMSRHINGY